MNHTQHAVLSCASDVLETYSPVPIQSAKRLSPQNLRVMSIRPDLLSPSLPVPQHVARVHLPKQPPDKKTALWNHLARKVESLIQSKCDAECRSLTRCRLLGITICDAIWLCEHRVYSYSITRIGPQFTSPCPSSLPPFFEKSCVRRNVQVSLIIWPFSMSARISGATTLEPVEIWGGGVIKIFDSEKKRDLTYLEGDPCVVRQTTHGSVWYYLLKLCFYSSNLGLI